MQQTCTNCGTEFQITDQDLTFYDRVSPTFDGKKYAIPAPVMCPDCRLQQRLAYRNDRNFYNRKSDKSGKDLICIYSEDKPYTVYDKEEWWADDWDPKTYGRDIDLSRPFFEQFQELRLEVPRANLFTINAENSYYTNHALNIRNCYLIWGGGDDEDCLYGNFIAFCKDTVDGFSLFSCEQCYEGVASERCYNCIGFVNCRDCTDCVMVEECSSCKYCIGCFGLSRKEYCLFNEQLTKEEWQKRKAELASMTQEKFQLLRKKLDELKTKLPHRGSHIFASENCTGDHIYNSKNCHHCFDIKDCEDCKYTAFTPKSKDCYDCTFTAPDGPEISYQAASSVGGQRMLFTFLAYYCSDIYYSQECHNSDNLFGCASMRHDKYCILNKQYSEEDYYKEVGRLIDHMKETGEWGQYFPLTNAPIAYNESNANDYFPMTKTEVKARNWPWRDEDSIKEQGELITTVPKHIEEVDESILEKVFTCEITGKQYKINPQELAFYKRMKICVPRKHAVQRHFDRLKQRTPRQLWMRVCPKCKKEMFTSYAPERTETVWCEECYLKEVY